MAAPMQRASRRHCAAQPEAHLDTLKVPHRRYSQGLDLFGWKVPYGRKECQVRDGIDLATSHRARAWEGAAENWREGAGLERSSASSDDVVVVMPRPYRLGAWESRFVNRLGETSASRREMTVAGYSPLSTSARFPSRQTSVTSVGPEDWR